MLVVVKTPHIDINIKGDIPNNLLEVLKKDFGDLLQLSEEEDDAVDPFETGWYKNIKADMKPGDYMRIYRENAGLTQEQLGKMLGDVSRQNISGMERGTRAISKNMAKKLADVFNKPVSDFI